MIEIYNNKIKNIEEISNIEFVFESMYMLNDYICIKYINYAYHVDMCIKPSYISNYYFSMHKNIYGKIFIEYEKLFNEIKLVIY